MRKELARLIECGAGGLPVPRFFMRKGRRAFMGNTSNFANIKITITRKNFFAAGEREALANFTPHKHIVRGCRPVRVLLPITYNNLSELKAGNKI